MIQKYDDGNTYGTCDCCGESVWAGSEMYNEPTALLAGSMLLCNDTCAETILTRLQQAVPEIFTKILEEVQQT